MREHYHALVWIDHHEARIFQFNQEESARTTVRSSHPQEHRHHRADAHGSGHVPIDYALLERVAQAVTNAGAILITGPGSAKRELATHIARRHPDLFRRISAVETLDHPTDAEMLALARRFFRHDDRTHLQIQP